MKHIFKPLLGVAVGAVALLATAPVQAQDATASASNTTSARVTVLDKQTNRRETVVLVAGQPATVGSISVLLTKCLPDYAAQLGQDVAWLDITESATGSGRVAPWFSGWMFNTYPEISTLDHPRYDVILQGCGVKARQIIRTMGTAPVLDSTQPVKDTESDDDQTGDTNPNDGNADPYTVPGVKDESTPQPAAAQAEPAEPQPAAPEPAASPATPAPTQEDQQDLHHLMDTGTY